MTPPHPHVRRRIFLFVALTAWLLALGGLGFALAGDAGEEKTALPTKAGPATVPPLTTGAVGSTAVGSAKPGIVFGARILGGVQPDQPGHGKTDAAERT